MSIPSFDLTGRVVIVTGGSRGIGNAIARGSAERGAKVVIAARSADQCEEAAQALRDSGGDAIGVRTHVGDLDSLKNLVNATLDAFGAIDVLVNNAATGLAQPIGEYTPEAWQKSLDVNLRGPVFLFQECLPHLRQSSHAAVLNVITAGAFLPTPDESIYGVAKTGLLSFTRSSAHRCASDGIRINALAPGTVDTAMTRSLGEEGFNFLSGVSAMGRMAEPDEMVGAALLMISDAGSYMTGQVVIVDGGLVVAR